jgi:hypothetical protein
MMDNTSADGAAARAATAWGISLGTTRMFRFTSSRLLILNVLRGVDRGTVNVTGQCHYLGTKHLESGRLFVSARGWGSQPVGSNCVHLQDGKPSAFQVLV